MVPVGATMAPHADPVKLALERAAQRAARVAVLDAVGQEPEPGDLQGACARCGMQKGGNFRNSKWGCLKMGMSQFSERKRAHLQICQHKLGLY